MKTFKEFIKEAGDYWHPDPEKDKRISGVGNKLRARQDGSRSNTTKDNANKLKPGESYIDYSKRKASLTSSPSPTKKLGLRDRIKIKLGNIIDRASGIK